MTVENKRLADAIQAFRNLPMLHHMQTLREREAIAIKVLEKYANPDNWAKTNPCCVDVWLLDDDGYEPAQKALEDLK